MFKIFKSRILLTSLILSGFFLIPLNGSSQNSELGTWYIYLGNKKLNSKWNWHHEVQFRNYDVVGDLEQLLLRTGIGYNLTENNNNVLLGYGYILSKNYQDNMFDDKISVNEHRIFQQFTTKQSIASIKLTHRYRFEQRFVESDFKFRFRYFLSLQIPLLKGGSNDVYFSAYNEIFLNSEKEVFDRNRVYGGLGFKLSDMVRLELGYMNQFFNSSGRDQINVITFVNF